MATNDTPSYFPCSAFLRAIGYILSSRMLKKARLLTHPTLAATSPARPESAETASSPKYAPSPKQGRTSAVDPRFTFHASRFTVPGSDARTPLADFFSILLKEPLALSSGGNMFFRSILGHSPSRDHNLLREQPRRDLFIFEGVARILLRHHFPNHLSHRHGRHHVGRLIRSLQASIEEEF